MPYVKYLLDFWVMTNMICIILSNNKFPYIFFWGGGGNVIVLILKPLNNFLLKTLCCTLRKITLTRNYDGQWEYIIILVVLNFFFLFFRESSNLQCLLMMIALYHKTKTPIDFWYRRGLNSKSLIQPSELYQLS